MTKRHDPESVPLTEIRRQRPTDEQAVAARRDAILDESLSNVLADLRKRSRLTQKELADRIGIDQPRVSRIERSDLLHMEVGSLAAYAEAIGGSLELVVHLDGQAIPIPARPWHNAQAKPDPSCAPSVRPPKPSARHASTAKRRAAKAV